MEHCIVCNQKTDSLCEGCKQVAYCSTQCQTADWNESHAITCALDKQMSLSSVLTKQEKKASHLIGPIKLEMRDNLFTFDVYLSLIGGGGGGGKDDYDIVYEYVKPRLYLIRSDLTTAFTSEEEKARLLDEATFLVQKIFASPEKYDELSRESDHMRKILSESEKKTSSRAYVGTEKIKLGEKLFMFRVFLSGDGRKNRTDYDFVTGPGFTQFYIIRSKDKAKKLKAAEMKEKAMKIARKLIEEVFDSDKMRSLLEAVIDYSDMGVQTCREILDHVLESTPGDATSLFLVSGTSYSIGNRLILLHQMMKRKTFPTAVHTRAQWKVIFGDSTEIKAGERAYAICMPKSVQKKDDKKKKGVDDEGDGYMMFVSKSIMFTQSQTTAAHKIAPLAVTPGFDYKLALEKLGVKIVSWDEGMQNTLMAFFNPSIHGTCAGFAYGNNMTINVNAKDKEGAYFHELAHIVLKHVGNTDLPKKVKEAEAESVAILCKVILRITNTADNVKYMRNWYKENLTIDMYKRIARATDQILTAGRVTAVDNAEIEMD